MLQKVRLGDLLIEKKVITPDQLNEALSEQKKSSLKLGRILTELGFVNENQLLEVLSEQLNIVYVDLKFFDLKKELVQKLPESLARRFRAIVLAESETHYQVGMVDPCDLFAYDEISKLLSKPVQLAVVKEAELLSLLDIMYRKTEEISDLAEELDSSLGEVEFDLDDLDAEAGESDAPVVKLLHSIFEDAVQVSASDIHIEPDESVLRIRQRVDGVLQEQIVNEKRIAPALVLRLKLMAHLNISEKRLPQDGRFNIRVKDKSIDVRLSTMPIAFGESVVMRLLDQSKGFLDLHKLGMPNDMLQQFEELIHKPHGMILVTGPTGSGKTTTLYSGLKELNKIEKKIITIEDPVEYRLPRVNQVQVNEKIDLTFGRVLRTSLRQDPDIIMVGEVRDQETAEIALRSAITGHLVLSTLHTNDAITSPIRLVDMGVPSYLAAIALRAVIAQRLVRRVCESCSTDYKLNERDKTWIQSVNKDAVKSKGFKVGKGCSYCGQTGYRGRIGVYELVIMDKHCVAALRDGDQQKFIAAVKNTPDYKSLAEQGLILAEQGITSLEEIYRISEAVEDETEEVTGAAVKVSDFPKPNKSASA